MDSFKTSMSASELEKENSTSNLLLIQPPPDLAVVIDKLASYVLKNGSGFEEKILEKERNNPKFSFLLCSDPYYLWYRHRLGLLRKGEISPLVLSKSSSVTAIPIATNIKRHSQTPTKPPPEPEPFIFTNFSTSSISKADFDIINLVARYHAISLQNGDGNFLNSLKIKESRNTQFDFLQENHSLNPLFQDLKGQYTILLSNNGSMNTHITKSSIINLVNSHVKWKIWKLSQEDEERKQEFIENIDWNDFVLTETINFPSKIEKDMTYYPPILDFETLQSLSISHRKMLWEGDLSFLEVENIENIDDNEDYYDKEDDSEEEMDMSSSSSSDDDTLSEKEEEKGEQSHDGIKVVHGYRPSNEIKVMKAIMESCPICLKLFPATEISEHIRIESLDPKWAEQRLKYLSKHQFSNLSIDGAEVVNRLREARHVRDQFSKLTQKEIEEKISMAKKETSSKTIQWDGKQ